MHSHIFCCNSNRILTLGNEISAILMITIVCATRKLRISTLRFVFVFFISTAYAFPVYGSDKEHIIKFKCSGWFRLDFVKAHWESEERSRFFLKRYMSISAKI